MEGRCPVENCLVIPRIPPKIGESAAIGRLQPGSKAGAAGGRRADIGDPWAQMEAQKEAGSLRIRRLSPGSERCAGPGRQSPRVPPSDGLKRPAHLFAVPGPPSVFPL